MTYMRIYVDENQSSGFRRVPINIRENRRGQSRMDSSTTLAALGTQVTEQTQKTKNVV
jgi:hypothetical protein